MAADLLLGSLVRDSSEVVLHVNHVLGFVLLDGCHICLIADGLDHKLVEYVVLLPQMKWMLLQGLGNLHFLLGLFPDALGSQANQLILVEFLFSLKSYRELSVRNIWSLLGTICALVSYRWQLDGAEDVFAIIEWRLEHLDLVGLLVHA